MRHIPIDHVPGGQPAQDVLAYIEDLVAADPNINCSRLSRLLRRRFGRKRTVRMFGNWPHVITEVDGVLYDKGGALFAEWHPGSREYRNAKDRWPLSNGKKRKACPSHQNSTR